MLRLRRLPMLQPCRLLAQGRQHRVVSELLLLVTRWWFLLPALGHLHQEMDFQTGQNGWMICLLVWPRTEPRRLCISDMCGVVWSAKGF